jgi:serine protease Do
MSFLRKSPLLLLFVLPALATVGFAWQYDGTPLDELTPEQRLSRRITPEVEVVRAATPAVVFIQTNTKRRTRNFFGQIYDMNGQSSGSGVVLSSDGFIVTNYHVVKDATEIRVSFEKSIDDTVYDADLLSFVAEEDLALLKIRDSGGREFATVPLGTSSDLMIGEKVVAIGNPYGHTNTVSVGIISGLHRGVKIQDPSTGLQLHFNDLIQTDASINPGNSGGPLININGELIGINNAVNQNAENIGFAIPIDRVKEVLQQQLISPDRHNAWLGFEINDSMEARLVIPGSPAALAGLREGDRLLGLDGQMFDGLDSYRLARVAMRPGAPTSFRVKRGSKSLTIPIQAWDKSDGLIYERLGVQVERIVYGRRSRALRISEILPDGPAASIGLQVDDVINAMRPRSGRLTRAVTFSDRIDLAKFLDVLEPATELLVEIRRGNKLYQGTLVVE